MAIGSHGAHANMFPDSSNTNMDMGISIQHKVNGSTVGGNPLKNITYGAWGSWETSSFMSNCTPWSPDASTVLLGKTFIQTTICDAEETRTRDVTYHYQDGTKNVISESETVITKIDDEDEAVGTKDYITGSEITYSTWYRSGSLHSCSSWTPSASTVDEGKSFTQSSSCTQDYIRYKYTNNVWASGETSLKSTVNEYKKENVTSSKTAIGTKKTSKYVWRRTGEMQVQPGGSAINGAECTKLGAKDLGPTAEAGTVIIMAVPMPKTLVYECVEE